MISPLQVYIPKTIEEKTSCSASSTFGWLGQKCVRFSRLTGQCLLFSLNATRFAGMICKKIPAIVTNSALTALNGVGFVFVPYNVDLVVKLFKDAYHGRESGYYTVTVLASLKGLEVLSNLGLVMAGFGASIEGLNGNDEEQKTIYRWMTPIGEASLVLGMGLTAAYMVMNHIALRRLKEVLATGQAPQVIKGFLTSQNLSPETEEQNSLIINPDKPMASLLRFCLDKDTLNQFLKEIVRVDVEDVECQESMLEVVRSNIETQQRINLGGQVVLIIIGDVLLAVEKYYTPTSFVSASINLGVSGAYTLKIIVETLREVGQRSSMTRIAETSSFDPV